MNRKLSNEVISEISIVSKCSYLLITAFICITSFCHAQVKEGSLWGGGIINFGSIENDVQDIPEDNIYSKRAFVSVFIGKSFSEKSIFGINLQYGHERIRSIRITRVANEESLGGGFFYRRYTHLGKSFFLFGHVDLIYTRGRGHVILQENPADFEKYKSYQFSLNIYPGVSYAINKNIHLEIGAGNLLSAFYGQETRHVEFPVNNVRDERATRYGVTSDFNSSFLGDFKFGFRFLLNGKASSS